MINLDIGPRLLESDVAIELLCSISSFYGFEKTGVKVVSLHFAYLYFCISLVQCNNVVTHKSRKMGSLHLFDIKDEILKANFLKFRNLL